MKIEERTYHIMGRVGAAALVVGILTLIAGLVLGIIGIVNGGRLLRTRREITE